MNDYDKLKNGICKKKILVTGHTGFVGVWLCTVLCKMECDVTGFSLQEQTGSLYEKVKNSLSLKSVYGDLRHRDEAKELIMDTKPDIVFHLAAFGFVKECYEDPESAYATNVQGTLNLFEAIKDMDRPCRIVVASSDKVYNNIDCTHRLFKEDDSLGGMDPYSSSKTCEDILAQSYFDSYLVNKGCSLCIIRPSNILGGGDHNMNRLIPSIYFNLKRGIKPEIRNPDSVRPWQNILDIVDAYITVAETESKGCLIYNAGPEKEGIKTVGEIASYVSMLYGMDVQEGHDNSTESEVKEKAFLGLSIDKIKKELGWKPRRTLEQTLDEIYEFYNNDDGSNTYDLCMSQISRYYEER